MTKRCLDEGILQSYIDGELSQEQAAAAASHIAACDACASALAEAEQETSFFFAAFAPDDSVSVPTEVLRARINAAVAQMESQSEAGGASSRGTRLGGLLASLSGLFAFTPRAAAAFASVLAVVAAAVIYFSAQRSQHAPAGSQGAGEIAVVNPAPERPSAVTQTPDETQATGEVRQKNAEPASTSTRRKVNAGPAYLQANFNSRRAASPGSVKRESPAPAAEKEQALPGEKEYQAAIASLEKTIKLGGDASLRPSLRAEYERNIALLDSAISQTRQVAAQNPKDTDAVGFLMAAYQSKVELLTKVADQAQVAALGR